ncbi:MAG: dTDP-3-amino-3,6-dideoxy-alpha-D-galactopyranose transaminase [Verrucomicrobia bacterium ADurb.Bin345]|nr:MAG: dTDP-3-amino-3,6-dideoxy-alpha-D-galactopyranose transaminase [Verrucomicrobia bacterium ADurb.Bin345]
MRVPFVDLQIQFAGLRDEIVPRVEDIMRRSAFILGEEVAEFERDFAAFCGAKHCVGVASGCDALLWALKACGIGPGDEVITVANTYIATVLAVQFAGARTVLVDCLEDTYEIDPEAVRRAITPRTKALMPVHLYGRSADMEAIMAIAREHGLLVIEDAAQAHGATFRGKACGTFGRVGCFSFYPGKNLGAYGDGGAIVTDDVAIAEHVRMLRNYGQQRKYHHEISGWNSRLDTIQAAVLKAKLPRLAAWNRARAEHAEAYRRRLGGLPLTLPAEPKDGQHIYHLFVVQTERRDELLAFLERNGISCGIHYPVPVHLQKACASLGYGPGSFPVTEKLAGRILSLPMFPELTDGQIACVCDVIHQFWRP